MGKRNRFLKTATASCHAQNIWHLCRLAFLFEGCKFVSPFFCFTVFSIFPDLFLIWYLCMIVRWMFLNCDISVNVWTRHHVQQVSCFIRRTKKSEGPARQAHENMSRSEYLSRHSQSSSVSWLRKKENPVQLLKTTGPDWSARFSQR